MDAFKLINWSKVSPSDFEILCSVLLSRQGFSNTEVIGGSGDRGRDIIATRIDNVSPVIKLTQTWIFQCKRYTTKTLQIYEIKENIAWAEFHNPDYLVFIGNYSAVRRK